MTLIGTYDPDLDADLLGVTLRGTIDGAVWSCCQTLHTFVITLARVNPTRWLVTVLLCFAPELARLVDVESLPGQGWVWNFALP